MKTIKWMGYDWRTLKPDGGPFHADNPHMWYDDKMTRVLTDGSLALDAKYSPNTYIISNKIYHPEIAVGLITSTKTFYYGKFEIYAKLPDGAWCWPAFWLTGTKTWPPEIDIFEGYSNKYNSYFSFQFFKPCAHYAVRTNAWKNVYPKQKQLGQKQHKAFKDPDAFNYFTLEWQPKKIKIYFNSHLVREFKDKKLLSQMAEQGMKVILNNGCRNDAKKLYYSYKMNTFHVKSFVYMPY